MSLCYRCNAAQGRAAATIVQNHCRQTACFGPRRRRRYLQKLQKLCQTRGRRTLHASRADSGLKFCPIDPAELLVGCPERIAYTKRFITADHASWPLKTTRKATRMTADLICKG